MGDDEPLAHYELSEDLTVRVARESVRIDGVSGPLVHLSEEELRRLCVVVGPAALDVMGRNRS
jgi:hypothetical protein